MRWYWAIAASVLGACRFGFDPALTGSDDAHPIDRDGAPDTMPVADANEPTDDARDDANASPDASVMTVTITFGERPTSMRKTVTRDTWLEQARGSFNFGSSEDVSVANFATQREHSLLWFDLTSLTPGTQVTAAQVSVVRLDYGDETPGPIEVRLLSESWVEGTNSGSPGTGASWTTRDGSTAWTTGGGTTSQLLGTVTPTATEVLLPLPASVVQAWVADPATNHGILVTSSSIGTHFHFESSASSVSGGANRPELSVTIVQ